jgi:hypothetical protein
MLRYRTRFAGVCVTAGLLCASAGARPANDTCSGAIPIGLGSVNGTTRGASSNGDTNCGNSSAAPDVYYQFIAPADAAFEVLTCDGNTDYDTVLSVHSACPATPANTIACNDDTDQNCTPLRSYVTFNGVRGTAYTIRVSGFGNNSGNFSLIIRQLGRPTNDTCAGAIPIAGTSAFFFADTTTAMSEGSMNCAIPTTGSPNQFYRYTPPSDGFVTFDTCDAATDFDTYLSASTDCPHTDLNLIACNDDDCGRRSSITFGVTEGATYIIRVAGFNGDRGHYALHWLHTPAGRPNDTCDGAQPISLGAVNGTTVGAAADTHVGCFPFDTPDVFYRFVSPTETIIRLDTCGPNTSFDTVLSVHSACPAGDSNVIACNDDGCDVRSNLTFSAKAGVPYIIRVAGFRDFGTFTLTATAEVDAVVFDPSTLGEYYLLRDNQNVGEFRGTAAGLGAHLASIGSFSENQFVSRSVMQAQNVARSAAIGLSDELDEGIFRWDTAQPVDFMFFSNGQPDNFNGAEDYVHIHDPVAGLWNDYPNGSHRGLFAVAESDRTILNSAINPANGHLYVLFNASSWEGANARARAMGGALVTIDGPAENEFVRANLADVISNDIWIGLSDVGAEGAFAWSDGSSSAFRNFASGEPNNFGGNENYVEMNATTGQWNDVPNIQLARPNHGVAEIVLPHALGAPVRGPNGCGTYVLLSQSGFYPALFAAERLGGKLVSITSAQENEFIRATFAAPGGGRRLWLGATDRDDDGNYIWVNGDPFAYTNYLAGEPNNLGGNEDYLEMFDPATGVWNDMSTLDPSAATHFAVIEMDCACDWNASGEVNSQDFFDFLTAFFAGNANFNCDAVTNSQDFFDFLTCFFNGCEP